MEKNKLESDLKSIAERILKLDDKEDVIKMHAEVSALYEKITVLKFAHENFDEDIPSIGNDSSFFGMLDKAFNNTVSDNIEVEGKIYVNNADVEDDSIMEPGIETIKDMVSQMPHETHEVDDIFKRVETTSSVKKEDLDSLTEDFKDMPEFDPVSKETHDSTEEKSLNNKIKTGKLSIGLNDKIAFIKHLFEGESEDYKRVISQLNTFSSYSEAKHFITNYVKPEYNAWQDKEEFETRFLEIIERKFD